MGNEFFDIDKNVFTNILEMYEIILPFEWHSFCMSIDLVESVMKMYHNDHLQVVQNFTVTHQDKEGLSKLMTRGHLGGSKFVGYIADFQVFGSALSENEILQWTTCQKQVIDLPPRPKCVPLSLPEGGWGIGSPPLGGNYYLAYLL